MDGKTELEFIINSRSDNSGIASHTAAVQADTVAMERQAAAASTSSERLSNTGTGIVNAPSNALGSSQAFTIQTQAEYEAIQKAHAALQARIPVLEAAGASTANLTAKLVALDAALSTDAALNVADQIETAKLTASKEALAVAMAEGAIAARAAREANDLTGAQNLARQAEAAAANAAAADAQMIASAVAAAKVQESRVKSFAETLAAQRANTVVTLEHAAAVETDTVALGMNATAMRESLVVGRELARGNYTRVPGSLTILGQQLGFVKSALAEVVPFLPVLGIGLAAVGIEAATFYSAFKKVNDEIEVLQSQGKELSRILSDQEGSEAMLKALDSMAGRADRAVKSIHDLTNASQDLATATKEQIELSDAADKASSTAASKEEQDRLGLISAAQGAGLISPQQAKAREAQSKRSAQDVADFEASKAEQAKIDALTSERDAQKQVALGASSQQDKQAGEIVGADMNVISKKSLYDSAKADAEKEAKFLASGQASKLSANEFSVEIAKQKLLIERSIDAEAAYTAAVNAAADVKKKADATDKLLEDSQKRILELNKQIDKLTGEKRTNDTTRANSQQSQLQSDLALQALSDIAEITKVGGEKKITPKAASETVAAVKDLVALLSSHQDLWETIAAALGETVPQLKAQVAKSLEQGRQLQSQISSN